MNVFTVIVNPPVTTQPGQAFSGKSSSHLHVVASTFETALEAVRRKYPGTEIRSISLLNYLSVPIVSGD